jgi:hypothetical protein
MDRNNEHVAVSKCADKSLHSLAAVIQLIVNSDNQRSTVNFKFQQIVYAINFLTLLAHRRMRRSICLVTTTSGDVYKIWQEVHKGLPALQCIKKRNATVEETDSVILEFDGHHVPHMSLK